MNKEQLLYTILAFIIIFLTSCFNVFIDSSYPTVVLNTFSAIISIVFAWKLLCVEIE